MLFLHYDDTTDAKVSLLIGVLGIFFMHSRNWTCGIMGHMMFVFGLFPL